MGGFQSLRRGQADCMTHARRVRILSSQLVQALHDAGVIEEHPDNIRRIIIDANADTWDVTIYLECYADERLLNVIRDLDGLRIEPDPDAAQYRLPRERG
jgi:hypothetical protein